MNCQRLGVDKLKTLGDPIIEVPSCFFEFYLYELEQVLMINIREKSSPPSSMGRGKGMIMK